MNWECGCIICLTKFIYKKKKKISNLTRISSGISESNQPKNNAKKLVLPTGFDPAA